MNIYFAPLLIFRIKIKVMPTFPNNIKTPVENWKTGSRYYVVRAGDAWNTPEHQREIVDICNQPAVYRLFHDALEGKPYLMEKASGFLQWAEEGWKNQTHFVFFAVTEAGAIAAACDIKTNDLDGGEVGYWLGEQHSGIMTNTVSVVCDLAWQAGYKSLFARVLKSNWRSANVLERSGFVKDTAKSLADDKLDWFTLSADLK